MSLPIPPLISWTIPCVPSRLFNSRYKSPSLCGEIGESTTCQHVTKTSELTKKPDPSGVISNRLLAAGRYLMTENTACLTSATTESKSRSLVGIFPAGTHIRSEEHKSE